MRHLAELREEIAEPQDLLAGSDGSNELRLGRGKGDDQLQL